MIISPSILGIGLPRVAQYKTVRITEYPIQQNKILLRTRFSSSCGGRFFIEKAV